MPENEFEKRVSADMGGLKFKPSDSVWQHVELRIRKKRKRRIIFFIVLLAGIGLFGLWQLNTRQGEKDGTANMIEEGTTEPASSEKNNSPLLKQDTASETKNKKPATAESEIRFADEPVSKVNEKLKVITDNTQTSPETKTAVVIIPEQTLNVKKPAEVQKNEPADTSMKQENKIETKKEIEQVDSLNISKPESSLEVKTEPAEIKPSDPLTDSVKTDQNREEKKKDAETDSLQKKNELKDSLQTIQKKLIVKKWDWGFRLSPGLSSLSDKFLSLNMNKSADQVAGSPSPGSGGGQTPAGPSDSKSGFSLQTGVFAKRKISSKSSMSVGVQYAYYSERLQVGSRRDSLLTNNYFAATGAERLFSAGATGTSQTRITNSFHFAEITAIYHLQVNKRIDKPVSLDLGLSFGRMIAGNALVYDTAFGGVYYKNKGLLKKNQFGLSGAVSWTIVNRNGVQWSLGPVTDIHLNRLYANPQNDKKYIVFTGLRTSVFFSRKK